MYARRYNISGSKTLKLILYTNKFCSTWSFPSPCIHAHTHAQYRLTLFNEMVGSNEVHAYAKYETNF